MSDPFNLLNLADESLHPILTCLADEDFTEPLMKRFMYLKINTFF